MDESQTVGSTIRRSSSPMLNQTSQPNNRVQIVGLQNRVNYPLIGIVKALHQTIPNREFETVIYGSSGFNEM